MCRRDSAKCGRDEELVILGKVVVGQLSVHPDMQLYSLSPCMVDKYSHNVILPEVIAVSSLRRWKDLGVSGPCLQGGEIAGARRGPLHTATEAHCRGILGSKREIC